MNDYIIKYNTNHKRFPFKTLLKSETINLIIKPVIKDIINQKMTVTTSQQIQKKFQNTSKKDKTK